MFDSIIYIISLTNCRMISTLTKLGEGTFAEVFGAQDEQKTKFAMKVQKTVNHSSCVDYSMTTSDRSN